MQQYHYIWLEAHPEYDENWLSQALSAGFDIHHVDGDHGNDGPANLMMIEKSDHAKMHGNEGFFNADRANWEAYEKRVKLGETSYQLRETGMLWTDVGEKLGYKPERSCASAMSVAKAYALYHSKEWPIPHISDCTCSRCKAKRNRET